jgi:hypothetical protein
MSHVPERVELYVCASCQAAYAGSVVESEADHHYEAPERCAGCDGTDFVPIEQWPHYTGATNA